jgi:ABC-type antimicrobial peptide transport system permease subunit
MDGPGVPLRPSIYVPLPAQQWPELVVRTSRRSTAVTDAVAATVGRFARPGWQISVKSVDEAFDKITADRRFAAMVLGLFGLLATAIGAAGVYAVMAATVEQQRRDLAVRVALGASTVRVTRDVLANATAYVWAGLAIGLPAGWWVSRFFASLLFGITPSNVTTYAIDVGLLVAVGLAAALVPARQAGRIDPIAALKN